jgi:hypothetical protein
MDRVVDILAALSPTVKIGWAVWLAASIFLLEWYVRGRGIPPAPPPADPHTGADQSAEPANPTP